MEAFVSFAKTFFMAAVSAVQRERPLSVLLVLMECFSMEQFAVTAPHLVLLAPAKQPALVVQQA